MSSPVWDHDSEVTTAERRLARQLMTKDDYRKGYRNGENLIFEVLPRLSTSDHPIRVVLEPEGHLFYLPEEGGYYRVFMLCVNTERITWSYTCRLGPLDQYLAKYLWLRADPLGLLFVANPLFSDAHATRQYCTLLKAVAVEAQRSNEYRFYY